jgi:hypothetical protein
MRRGMRHLVRVCLREGGAGGGARPDITGNFFVTAEGGLRTDTGRFATSCSCSLGDRPISGNG